jgi:hypothetical protein
MMASAVAIASSTGTISPAGLSSVPISSQGPGDASETTAGRPHAMASNSAFGVPSNREAITNIFAPRKNGNGSDT